MYLFFFFWSRKCSVSSGVVSAQLELLVHLTWIAHVVQIRKQQLHFVAFLFSIHPHLLEPEMRFLSIAGHKLIRPSSHVVGIIWFGQRGCICDEGRYARNVRRLLSWFPELVDEELLA